jgi:hypothetical protein
MSASTFRVLAVSVLVLATAAAADRGALTVDAAGGVSATSVAAPEASPAKSTTSFAGSIWLGARYALSNTLELTATGFFEPPVMIGQNGITLHDAAGDFPGTLTHAFTRYGGQVGARIVRGYDWRFVAGLELGFAQRAYSQLAMLNDSNPSNVVSYGLTLPDRNAPAFVVSPCIGVEWVPADAWSLSVLPRAQLLLGTGVTWAVVVPIQLSFSWWL